VTGCCDHGNELSDSIKRGEFLGELNNSQLLKDSAVWSQGFVCWLGDCGVLTTKY